MRNKILVLAVVGLTALGLSGCQSGSNTSDLYGVGKTCNVPVDDNGDTIIIDMEDENDTETVQDLACVLNELETPRSIVKRMEQTRAIDGVQTGEWGSFRATWSFHPDTGLDVIFERYVPLS